MKQGRSRHDHDDGLRKTDAASGDHIHEREANRDSTGTIETKLTNHPRQTIFVEAKGDGLAARGIQRGDLVAIDMALSEDPQPGDVVLLCTTDDDYLLREWQPQTRPDRRRGGKLPVVIGVKVGFFRPGRSSEGLRP